MIIPVILSGGTGTRLWPISRETHPKPFMKLPDGQSLIQKTFSRAASLTNIAEILTITNHEYYLKCLPEYESTIVLQPQLKRSFLLEPSGRNTAPAIAMAALKAYHTYGPDSIILVLPADHLIAQTAAFVQACEIAFALARNNRIVTFGTQPTAPETGFGYIECGSPLATPHTFDVRRFVEKPALEVAQNYVNSKQFLWNTGMFCFNANSILTQFDLHAPDLLAAAKKCWEISLQQSTNPSVIKFDTESFLAIPSISIDYAIMEKSNNIAVVACAFDWQDIGSWKAFKSIHAHDHNGNTISGDAIMIDSHDNFIHSDGRMVASIGVNDLVVIDTPDALLISHRDRSQDVGQVVQALKMNAHESYHSHRTVIRPWGTYTILEDTPTFKIKRLVIKPKASISLQSHQHRSEHWVVVEGQANIINGELQYQLNKNESTFIPQKNIHRISNDADSNLVIIEVQTGSYLGEDDIIRYEDTYGRVV